MMYMYDVIDHMTDHVTFVDSLAAGFNDLFINQNIKGVCEIPENRAYVVSLQ